LAISSGKALVLLQEQGQFIKTAQALKAGIHPRTLYQLRDNGSIKQVSRGVYRLADQAPLSNPDLFTVATRILQGVICLVSALAFHELTTQIPKSVAIALPKGAEFPLLDYPTVTLHRFSAASLKAGIEIHEVDGIPPIKVYSPEKTIADCCKFRNQLGIEVFLEALKLYGSRKQANLTQILEYAEVCRAGKVIKPYLEALL
jgi:predicted transcriptional regulator of viral defense system